MASGDLITRNYSDFKGVDFSNDPGIVSLQRSPDALNIWKNYSNTQGMCIETRPGYRELINFNEKINGIFIYKKTLAIIHAGEKLYAWEGFPGNENSPTILKSDMKNERSQMYLFGGDLYINDGDHFLKYDGENLKDVADEAYVPTTTIGRKPSGGGTY